MQFCCLASVMNAELKALIDSLPDTLRARKTIHFKKDKVIFCKGESTTHAYLIVSGEVLVQNPHANGNIYLISLLGAGSFLSDLEILSNRLINSTTLIAGSDCTLLQFSVKNFNKALLSESKFLLLVSRLMAQKMYTESFRVGDSFYKKGLDKFNLYLIDLYNNRPEAGELVIAKTRQTIASEIGLSVKTVNRCVKTLRESGLIHICHGKIRVSSLNCAALVERVKRSA